MKSTPYLFLTLALVFSLSLFSQIPNGYYDGTTGLTGQDLKLKLHDIIKDHVEYSYDDLRDFILRKTDEDPNNSNNVMLFYTGRSQAKTTFGGGANDWNREHVWAKSHGDFGTTPPAGTDAHHMKPTDASVNSTRGNLDFDMGGNPVSEAPGCYVDSDSFEPRDAVKGDVARIIFYMATRYEGGSGEPDLEVVDRVNTSPSPEHGKLSVLLQWNQLDPPDDFERNRNDVIYYDYQHNRNPFIDHPEFVDAIWGDPSLVIPVDALVTSVFPNPFSDRINLSVAEGQYTYTVHSTLGEVVMQGSFAGSSHAVDLENLTNGLYVIQIYSPEKQVISKQKILKLNSL
jgi:endonuclease I